MINRNANFDAFRRLRRQSWIPDATWGGMSLTTVTQALETAWRRARVTAGAAPTAVVDWIERHAGEMVAASVVVPVPSPQAAVKGHVGRKGSL